jgi:hypothetical protein
MSTVKQIVGTRTALSISSVATLASGTYVTSEAYVANTNQPIDVVVEVMAGTTNTPAGNKQVVAFVQDSLDGTNFRSGPTAGTSTADEADLTYIGTVPVNTSAGTMLHRGLFSVANACGYVPHTFRIVLKNDLGVALTTATAFTSELSITVA